MTRKQIENRREHNTKYPEGYKGEFRDDALWEIALQLALFNEYNARMEVRYMELTARGIKRKYKGRSTKDKGRRK
jgi:hypothetical protein